MIGTTISHYCIQEELGRGGMGVVWKAQDTVLNRTVAIKVLPSNMALDEKRREMFLQEARLAASVSHGNIVQVFELGREAGLDYIVMEFVEGQPLNRVLHDQSLSPERIAQLGLQMADGLARAHRRGLVHRDIKPANILVTFEGDAKIVDFGLATLFSPDDATLQSITRSLASDAPEESPKEIVGTLPYMSPEQVRGDPLDARSDIFSFGCVLYEMTTGRRPFGGTKPAEIASEVLKSEPTPVPELLPTVPIDLHRIIEKTLRRRPADRYQHADDMVVDLRRLNRELETGSSLRYHELVNTSRRGFTRTWWRYIAAVMVLLGSFLGVQQLRHRPLTLDEHTILVLPFESQGTDEGIQYVGRAFAQAIAVQIAQAPALKVLPVPSASVGEERLTATAREFGAGRVVSGTLVRNGEQTQVTVTMLDPANNRIVWGTQVTVSHVDLSAAASSLSRETMEALGEKSEHPYDYVQNVSGSPQMATSTELAETKGHLDRHEDEQADLVATQLVTTFPLEHDAWLLKTWVKLRLWYRNRSEKYLGDINSGIERLLYLDAESPYPSMLRGLLSNGSGDHVRAVTFFTKVISRDDLTPQFRAWALRQRANANMSLGQLAESEKDLKGSLNYDPTNAYTRQDLSRLLRNMDRHDEAVEVARQALALRPADFQSYTNVAMSLDRSATRSEATPYYERAIQLHASQFTYSLLANHLQICGLRAQAVEAARVAATYSDEPYGCYNLTEAWMGMGDLDQALTFLHRAVRAGFSNIWLLENDPDLSPLRSEPSFQSLLDTVRSGLGEQ